MFRQVEIEVIQGDNLTFRFPIALSILSLLVAQSSEDVLWEFEAEEFLPVRAVAEDYEPSPTDGFLPVLGARFKSWKLEEAPPEMLALLAAVETREEARLRDEGPTKVPLQNVVYSQVPAGYREKRAARPLVPGEYNVLIFAEQGQGSTRFIIGA